MFCSSVSANPTTGTFTPYFSLMLSNHSPSNNSVDVSFSVTCSIDCNSSTGNVMNLSWYEKQNGIWVLTQKNLNINNGTYTYSFVNVSSYDTWYHWRVSLSDGLGNWVNDSFCFRSTKLEAGFTYYVTGHTITVRPYFGYGIDDFKFMLKGDNHTLSETEWIPYGDVTTHDFVVDFDKNYIVYLFYKVDGVVKALGKTIGVGSAKGSNVDIKDIGSIKPITTVDTEHDGFNDLSEVLDLQTSHIVLIVIVSVLVVMFLFRSKTRQILYIRNDLYGRKRRRK